MAPNHPPTSSRHEVGTRAPSLPAGYLTIRNLIDGKAAPGRLVHVFGLVKDCRLPIKTGGTDFKMTLTLFDDSVDSETEGFQIMIFRPEDQMPQIGATDVVQLRSVRVQDYRGNTSLITHRLTDVFVYSASKIPRPPGSARQALQMSSRRCAWKPTLQEYEYVSCLFHKTNRDYVPDEAAFQVLKVQSVNVKNKFSELRGVSEGRFQDLLVQVVKEPYDSGYNVTIWVTDYSEHPSFFNHSYQPGADGFERDDDPHGYLSKYSTGISDSKWPGPFGKMSMQVTCYDPHASVIRDDVRAGDWVALSNVHIKYGTNGANLEGVLREDRNAPSKVCVAILDPIAEMEKGKENVDARFKNAVQRKRDYEKERKMQLRNYQAEQGPQKRKADDEDEKTNSRSRRNKKRAKQFNKVDQLEAEQEKILGLNESVKCENDNRTIDLLSTLLELAYYSTKIDGEDVNLELPFVNASYRTHVRITDFHPRQVEDFAVSRKVTERDILSQNSDSEDSSEEEDRGTLDHLAGRKIWEWRFALQLEDASPKAKPPQKLWVLVGNADAQLLTGLDAADLRQDDDRLAQLRERLFTLWGDLEEKKLAAVKKAGQRKKRSGDRPPIDSDGEGQETDTPSSSQIRNKPFTCCIKQYGVKTKTDNLEEANAGGGEKWERMFGLFGVKVCHS